MTRAAKSQDALRRQKEAKQKKLLLVLAPILLLLLVWQGPAYLRLITGGASSSETAAPAPAPAPPATAPAATDPTAAPAPSTAGGATAADPAAPTTGETSLPDSDLPVSADAGQLVSFGRFIGRDPFKQQIAAAGAGGGTTSRPADGSRTRPDDDDDDVVDTRPTPPPPPSDPAPGAGDSPPPAGGDDGGDDVDATKALVSVNGVEEVVSVDGDPFPASDPLFHLVAIEGETIRIGLVSGSFSSRVETVTVKAGKPLTLVSQPDGLRYTIELVRLLAD